MAKSQASTSASSSIVVNSASCNHRVNLKEARKQQTRPEPQKNFERTLNKQVAHDVTICQSSSLCILHWLETTHLVERLANLRCKHVPGDRDLTEKREYFQSQIDKLKFESLTFLRLGETKADPQQLNQLNHCPPTWSSWRIRYVASAIFFFDACRQLAQLHSTSYLPGWTATWSR